ncbi:MAG: hypothetical protein IJS45_05980 [Clostridia bacterium]|nr:hypothetical protein [Clostridia bacterium]
MELDFELPRLSPEVSADALRIRAYLGRMAEQISAALSAIDEDNLSPRAAKALTASVKNEKDIDALKDAVVRTATLIKRTEEKLSATMRNEYAAISDIGEYTERAVATYEADGLGIDQFFRLVRSVAGEVDELSGYVRCGVLDGGVIGVEIGDAAGTSPFKVRLTGERLSFLCGSDEVAYMSDDSLVVTSASVSGRLTLGDYEISTADGLIFKYAGD